MDAPKPPAVEDSESKDASLSGLACLWDGSSAVRQRMRKKFNLLVHYDPKLQKMLNVKVEKTTHNVRTNAAVLSPVLKIMKVTGALPAKDKLMEQVVDVFGRFSMPITENLSNSQSWAIRDMISVLKKNKTKKAWHKDNGFASILWHVRSNIYLFCAMHVSYTLAAKGPSDPAASLGYGCM